MEKKNAKNVELNFFFCNHNYCCSNGNKLSYYKIREILQYLIGLNDDNVSDDFWFKLKASLKWQISEFPSKFD